MQDIILFSILYTLLISIVAIYYHFQGYKKGIEQTLLIVSSVEGPGYLEKLKPRLERLINDTKANS